MILYFTCIYMYVLTTCMYVHVFMVTFYFIFQQQYKDIQASAVRTNTTVIPVHDDDEGIQHRCTVYQLT